jgi:DNA-binding GntR family transcriptional regulator
MSAPSAVGPLREDPAMSAREPLARVSTVDALAAALRARILEGELGAGERLPERELTERYGVARHSVRAALRALAADGLITIEPNRGASVASLDAAAVKSLFELRAALELEAAHLALERNRGRLPDSVRRAVAELGAVCARGAPAWSDVADAHNAVHLAIVGAAHSERIARAYDGLAGEMRLFLTALRPHWTLERMAAHHEQLLDRLERVGPEALREHLRDGERTLLGGKKVTS